VIVLWLVEWSSVPGGYFSVGSLATGRIAEE
jgi:hypothetical protein